MPSIGYGEEYGYIDLQTAINGIPVDIIGLSFGSTADHVNIIGPGNQVVAFGRGKREPKDGKVTILQSAFEALVDNGGDPCGWAPWNITACFAPVGGTIRTYFIMYLRVKEWELSTKAGDTHSTIDLDVKIGKLKVTQ